MNKFTCVHLHKDLIAVVIGVLRDMGEWGAGIPTNYVDPTLSFHVLLAYSHTVLMICSPPFLVGPPFTLLLANGISSRKYVLEINGWLRLCFF